MATASHNSAASALSFPNRSGSVDATCRAGRFPIACMRFISVRCSTARSSVLTCRLLPDAQLKTNGRKITYNDLHDCCAPDGIVKIVAVNQREQLAIIKRPRVPECGGG